MVAMGGIFSEISLNASIKSMFEREKMCFQSGIFNSSTSKNDMISAFQL